MAVSSSTTQTPWWWAVVWGRRPERTLIRAAVLAIVCVFIFKFVLIPIRIEGPSMLPTYKDHGVNFVNRLSYLFHEPRRGDVVAIKTSGLSIMYMKRIIGLPGETIAFHDGYAVINGKALSRTVCATHKPLGDRTSHARSLGVLLRGR